MEGVVGRGPQAAGSKCLRGAALPSWKNISSLRTWLPTPRLTQNPPSTRTLEESVHFPKNLPQAPQKQALEKKSRARVSLIGLW